MVSRSAIAYTVTGLAFAAVIATSEPAVAQADSSQAQQKVVAKVGTYPNFSNYGVLGNPAVANSSQTGEWASIEEGRGAKGDRTAGVSLLKDAGPASISFSLGSSTGSRGTSLSQGVNGSMSIASGVLVGGNLAKTTDPEGKTKNSAVVGVAGIRSGNGYLVRAGLAHDVVQNAMSYAAEVRTGGKFEFTVSGKIGEKDGRIVDKGVGFQAKKGKLLLSMGRGGEDWRDMKAHARVFLGKTRIDLHLQGTGSQIVKKPGARLVAIRNF